MKDLTKDDKTDSPKRGSIPTKYEVHCLSYIHNLLSKITVIYMHSSNLQDTVLKDKSEVEKKTNSKKESLIKSAPEHENDNLEKVPCKTESTNKDSVSKAVKVFFIFKKLKVNLLFTTKSSR